MDLLNQNNKPQKKKYQRPFIRREYGNYYYLYYWDLDQQKRRKYSTRIKNQEAAYTELKRFQKSQLTNQSQVNIIKISDLLDVILKYRSNSFSKGTLNLYLMALNNLIKVTGNKPIKLLTFLDIEQFQNEMIKRVSKTTTNILLRTLKAAFNYCINTGELSFNPAKKVRQFVIEEKKRLCFGNNDLDRLLKTIKGHYIENLVKFALFTGARRSELVNLAWDDINLEDQILIIRNKENFSTKTKKERSIPISDDLLILIKKMRGINEENNIVSYYSPEDFLFRKSDGGRYSASHISRVFKKYLRLEGFDEKYHFHCLRHTFITDLIKSGVNINYVKELAGHADIKTTMGYIHIVTEDLREAVNKIKLSS